MVDAPNGYDDKKAEATELLVAELLLNDGWQVVHAPAVDREAQKGDNAPLVRAIEEANRMPDIFCIKSGRSCFVEVKYKSSGPEYINKNDQYEHFIDFPAWTDYHDIQKLSGIDVWLMIYEADVNDSESHILQRQEISGVTVADMWTEVDVKENNGNKYGNPGVFTPRRDYMPINIGREHAPNNFFGQDRIDIRIDNSKQVIPSEDAQDDCEQTDVTDDSQKGLGEFADDD